jgi:hypothetical protein
VAFKQLARKVKGERLYLSIANPSSFSWRITLSIKISN